MKRSLPKSPPPRLSPVAGEGRNETQQGVLEEIEEMDSKAMSNP